jgi:hypothetical protein
VPTDRPKHLVHILAREFASNLATPTLIVDAEGITLLGTSAKFIESLAAGAIDQGAATRKGTIDREMVVAVAQQLMPGDNARDAGERGTGISTPGSGKR